MRLARQGRTKKFLAKIRKYFLTLWLYVYLFGHNGGSYRRKW